MIPLLDIKSAAARWEELTGKPISSKTIQRMIERKELDGDRVGPFFVVTVESLEAAATHDAVKGTWEARDTAHNPADAARNARAAASFAIAAAARCGGGDAPKLLRLGAELTEIALELEGRAPPKKKGRLVIARVDKPDDD